MGAGFDCDQCGKKFDGTDETYCEECISSLKNDLEAMEKERDNLQEELDDLQGQYDELEEKYNAPIHRFARGECLIEEGKKDGKEDTKDETQP